ncbi:MAG: hypothetical protein SFW36_05515 [Leptolyngbyaceae cyanobacterium bins.59]|nr:hypothetical protein [Leptolyngbyaceae cyanobacterium bins.59]
MPSETLCAVILTALPVEFKAVRSFLTDCQRVRHPEKGNIYEHGKFEASNRIWDVGIAEIGAGDSGAAQQTERAISFFKPDVILFVGVAGGIKDVDIGDVVVATKIYGYESGKAKEIFEPRPTLGLSSFALLEEAKAEARSLEQAWLSRLKPLSEPHPKVVVGPIAAGEKVIASTKSSIYQFLRSNYGDALAVEMEGYGFLQAASAEQDPISAIVVRGISDLIDNKNAEMKDGIPQEPESVRQEKASLHASAFAFQILANFDPKPRVTGFQPPPNVSSPVWDDLFKFFRDEDLAIIAPLCRQVFEEQLTQEEQDPYSELSQLNSISTLQTVFERKDDLKLAVQWVGRVISTFQQHPDGAPAQAVSPALQAWYDKYKPPDPIPEAEEKPPAYLLIALDPIDDRDKVAFTAELHYSSDASPKTDLVPQGRKCSIHEVGDFLSEAIQSAGNVKTIEIFLPWQHLKQPVHQWEIQISQRLGARRNRRSLWKIPRDTLVRSLDRLKEESWIDEWIEDMQERWQRLQRWRGEELQLICCCTENLNCEELQEALRNKLVFKFLSSLPEDEADLQDLLIEVLFSNVLVWFWAYECPSDTNAFSSTIDPLLSPQNLIDSATLARVIREQRQALPNLGVLYDCPTRLPVLVDWKNGRLREPAAESPLST